MDKRLVTALTLVIVGAWIVSFLVDIVDKSYEPHPTVHALMLTVAGAAFGMTLRKNEKDDAA